MNDSCPICDDPAACKGYAHLWRRLREDPARWKKVHDDVNGVTRGRGDDYLGPLVEQVKANLRETGVPFTYAGKCCGG